MNNEIVSALIGLIGAVVGGLIGGGAVFYQTKKMLADQNRQRELLLTEQNRQRELDHERETQSVAIVLLWEIDDFYRLSIRDVIRTLKNANPSELIVAKPLKFRSFPVFEATADKVGLFEAVVVQAIVGFYGSARAHAPHQRKKSGYPRAFSAWASRGAAHRSADPQGPARGTRFNCRRRVRLLSPNRQITSSMIQRNKPLQHSKHLPFGAARSSLLRRRSIYIPGRDSQRASRNWALGAAMLTR
jgi:hypothetical protein